MAGLAPWVFVVVLLRGACDAAVSDAQENTCLDSKANKQLVQSRKILKAVIDLQDMVVTEVEDMVALNDYPKNCSCHHDSVQTPLCKDGTRSPFGEQAGTEAEWCGSTKKVIQCPCEKPQMCNHTAGNGKTMKGGTYFCAKSCEEVLDGIFKNVCEPTPLPTPLPTPMPTPLPTTAPPTLMTAFFDAPSSVATTNNWGSAMRELMGFCQDKGYKTGVPTGHSGNHNDKEVRGIFCLKGEGVNWFDAPSSFGVEDDWGKAFRDINDKCEGGMTPEGYGGGIPNGHGASNLRGCYCFKRGSFFKSYDTPFSFSVNGNNDWAGALTQVGGWCQNKGFDWGFPNGHKGDNVRGANCFKKG